jgi:transcriptional accessory protein Tex/SPT6
MYTNINEVQDVLAELEKPGRDPRPEFRTAKFREDITEVGQFLYDLARFYNFMRIRNELIR